MPSCPNFGANGTRRVPCGRGQSALGPGGGDAPYEGLLGKQEEEDHGQDRDGARRHQVVPLHAAVLRLVTGEGERERIGVLTRKVDERPEKVIPGEDEVEEGGVLSGTMIRQKMRHSLHPSIRAASLSSSGIVLKNCRMRKMLKALPNHAGSHRGSRVPIIPRDLNTP